MTKIVETRGNSNCRTLPGEFRLVTDAPTCCYRCLDEWERKTALNLTAMLALNLTAMLAVKMIVCPKCGNKRCPKAQWHEYRCTGSNEPRQVGVLDQETAYA